MSDRKDILGRLPDPIPERSQSDSRRSTGWRPRVLETPTNMHPEGVPETAPVIAPLEGADSPRELPTLCDPSVVAASSGRGQDAGEGSPKRGLKSPDSTAKGNALEAGPPLHSEALKGRDTENLWRQFAEKLPALGSRMAMLDDLNTLAGELAWVDEDARSLLGGLKLKERDIWDAKVGFTLADCAVAESGSLLIANAPGRRRLGSLAVEIHVVLVPKDRIMMSLEEALVTIPERSCALITGSSRTADIEGVLVRGVHGPREVWVVPI